ncbi:MAG: hypothetical protein WCK39_03850 [Methanomassiliicoccales archaeon]
MSTLEDPLDPCDSCKNAGACAHCDGHMLFMGKVPVKPRPDEKCPDEEGEP